MKRPSLFRTTFFVISVMFSIIYLNSCSKITKYREAKNREEQQKRERESKETQKKLNEFSYRKEAVLLSIKYKVDEDKVFNLLIETQELNSENINLVLEGKSITRNRLTSFSEKYGISIDTL